MIFILKELLYVILDSLREGDWSGHVAAFQEIVRWYANGELEERCGNV